MKVTTKRKEVKQFEPIEVTIVIESEDELSNLLARVDCDYNIINKQFSEYIADNSDYNLFNKLRERWDEL